MIPLAVNRAEVEFDFETALERMRQSFEAFLAELEKPPPIVATRGPDAPPTSL